MIELSFGFTVGAQVEVLASAVKHFVDIREQRSVDASKSVARREKLGTENKSFPMVLRACKNGIDEPVFHSALHATETPTNEK